MICMVGMERIRTSGPLLPKQVQYEPEAINSAQVDVSFRKLRKRLGARQGKDGLLDLSLRA